jgi:predicted HNH restriction endonuclease
MEHDKLFVQVNDSIRELAHDGSPNETWDFICECPEVTCHAAVHLTLNEFDERRAASPPVPVHAVEHA